MNNGFEIKYQAVRKLCNGILDDPNGRLVDWMEDGDWKDATIEEIANEWNEYVA